MVGVEGRRVVVGREGTPALVSNGRGIKKGDARFGAGLEDSFSSSGETSHVALTHRCQIGNRGEAPE